MFVEGIYAGLIFSVAFALTQKTFPSWYRPGTKGKVAFAMAIVLLLLSGWESAAVFWPVQQLAYIVTAAFIKPNAPWGTSLRTDTDVDLRASHGNAEGGRDRKTDTASETRGDTRFFEGVINRITASTAFLKSIKEQQVALNRFKSVLWNGATEKILSQLGNDQRGIVLSMWADSMKKAEQHPKWGQWTSGNPGEFELTVSESVLTSLVDAAKKGALGDWVSPAYRLIEGLTNQE